MAEGVNELFVLHGAALYQVDRNLIKLAHLFGVNVRSITIASKYQNLWEAIAHRSNGECAVCTSAGTLRSLFDLASLPRWLAPNKAPSSLQLFVYGFEGTQEDCQIVRALSCGVLNSVRQIDAGENEYSVASPDSFSYEFSDLTFGQTNRLNDHVFQTATKDSKVLEHMRIGGNPFLISLENTPGFVTLAGTRNILDVDQPFPRGIRLLDSFSQLVPFMMFLRRVFGTRCWHGARKLGSLIIDDPLLTGRYGFLHYESLLNAMEESQFATNMAFIPWNYRRSRRKVIDLFKRYPGRYSLSVHGCDHTKAEFATTDSEILSLKARTALQRMTAHEQLTGLPFDRVMVFPGGHFSSRAIETLKASDYVAAVNSTEFATDLANDGLRIRDVLDVAVMRYSNFPIFIRRYPNRIAEFALDLFLGRPALIVVHHEDFRNGYAEIQHFAEQLNSRCGGIKWCSLEEIARRSYLIKRGAGDEMHVRLYTDHAIIQNSESETRVFQLWRKIDEEAPVPRVTVNDEIVSAESAGGSLRVKLKLNPGEEARVSLRALEPITTGSPEAGNLLYRMNVRARRYLCEFRDNYVGPCRRLVSSE